VLFAKARGVPILSLGDVTCAVGPIGIFLGRLANFVNGELWGRVTDVPWGVVFPNAGVVPRHPSELYEAGTEGLLLFIILFYLVNFTRAREKPGLVTGVFLIG
jgi:phosphatidylglycerol:prolipoprotein diacylglycerol transferase